MIIRIHSVKRVRSKGKLYFYHRATGQRITSPPDTTAFIAEVERLDQEGQGRKDRRSPPAYLPGTWGALVAAYRKAPEYTQLADRTKRDYTKVLDYLAKIDDMPLFQITSAACLGFRDQAFKKHKRRFANYVVHMLSVVLAWGKDRGDVTANVAAGLKKIAAPRDAPKQNRAWTEEECRIVLGAAGGGLRVAIALGMFAGMRGSDAVRVGWSAYDGRTIQWRQKKTGDPVWLPAHRELRAILDVTPRRSTTIVTGALGRPWSEATLRKEFRDHIVKLETAGRIGTGLTFHGLRSTGATTLADLRADVRAIQAMLGHRTPIMALKYSEEADRRRAGSAAIHLLERTPRARLHGKLLENRRPKRG